MEDNKIINSPSSLLQTLNVANRAITEIYELKIQEQNLRGQAQSQREIAKTFEYQRKNKSLRRGVIVGLVAYIVFSFVTCALDASSTIDKWGMMLVSLLNYVIPFGAGLIVWASSMGFSQTKFKSQYKYHIDLAEEAELNANYKHERITELVFNNAEAIDTLPIEYRFPEATGFLVRLFELGRANTLPEAYDKLEEQLHRWKMEDSMIQLIDGQKVTLAAVLMGNAKLDRIESNTRWI